MRFRDGVEHFVSASRSPGAVLFVTPMAIDGYQAGERAELSNTQGIYTWRTASSNWALELAAPSSDELGGWLSSPRFGPTDIRSRPDLIGKLTGMRVETLPAQSVAGRNCFVLRLSSGSRAQTQWIDERTGIVLREEETLAGVISSRREFTSFKSDPPTAEAFDLPANAIVIRGVPEPAILAAADRTAASLSADLDRVRGKIKPAGGAWVHGIATPEGFSYIQTEYRTNVKATKSPKGGSIDGPQLEPGGLPPGWTLSGMVDSENHAIVFGFGMPDGGSPRVLVADPAGTPDGSWFSIQIGEEQATFVAYYDQSGTLIVAPGKSASEAEKARRQRLDTINGNGAWVQSDFLDRKTGHTASFIQFYGAKLRDTIRHISLKDPKPAPDGPAGSEAFVMEKPIRLNVVRWKTPEGAYAVASSKLSVTELARWANTAR